jgi:glycosyltransferase involved in cell wall biosynthesis
MTSVALCTYNGEQYIRQQIESIINQTLPVDEIVVCDDGSTDETLSIIKSLRENTSVDIRIYRNETNLGVCANFQKAVNLCKGDIIFLSDQDDVWHNDKVETIVNYFNHNPQTQVVFSDGQLIDGSGKVISNGTLWRCFGVNSKCLKQIENGFGMEIFAFENRATGATMAIRRNFEYTSSFSRFCIDDILHDGALAMLALTSNQLGHINKCLIDYRIHSNQECGIGESQNNPVSNNPREVSYTATLWSKLPLPAPAADRIAFIVLRQRRQHQPLGIFRMIGSVGRYRKLYHSKWPGFLFFDIQQWSTVMWRRIFK